MEHLTMHMPAKLVAQLDAQVEQDKFESRSAAIRYYVRSGLQRKDKFDDGQ